jgi:hypothetical protein
MTYEKCEVCKSTGKINCSQCNSGELPCYICQGTGRLYRKRWIFSFSQECHACRGTKTIMCPFCGGSGSVTCKNCVDAGRIQSKTPGLITWNGVKLRIIRAISGYAHKIVEVELIDGVWPSDGDLITLCDGGVPPKGFLFGGEVKKSGAIAQVKIYTD